MWSPEFDVKPMKKAEEYIVRNVSNNNEYEVNSPNILRDNNCSSYVAVLRDRRFATA